MFIYYILFRVKIKYINFNDIICFFNNNYFIKHINVNIYIFKAIFWNPPHKYVFKNKAPPKPIGLKIYEAHGNIMFNIY